MKKDWVSLLIPCYNAEKYIDSCMSCILKQIYQYIEIIFVNDGSFDKSEEKIFAYQDEIRKKGYILKYRYQKNEGAASAINTALKMVEGEFIMLYDVDDVLMPEAVAEKAQYLKKNFRYDMVRNNGYYVNADSPNLIKGEFVSDSTEKNNEDIFEMLLRGTTNNWPGSFMVRSEALFKQIKNRDIYVSQFGQNLQIMLPVACFGKCGFIDKHLMNYMIYSNSHSHTTDINRKLELLNGYEQNRIQIVKNLELQREDKERFLSIIRRTYLQLRFDFAYNTKNFELLSENYKALKKEKICTGRDKIFYWERKSCFIAFLLKIKRKYIVKITSGNLNE